MKHFLKYWWPWILGLILILAACTSATPANTDKTDMKLIQQVNQVQVYKFTDWSFASDNMMAVCYVVIAPIDVAISCK